MSMTDANRAALSSAIEGWIAGDFDRYYALYADQVTHHGLAPEPLDDAGNRAFYGQLRAAFPDSQIVVDAVVAEGDLLSARFHLRGHHQGPFMGVEPTGTPIELQGQTMMRFHEGRVAERWTTSDLLGLMMQLGAIPPPEA